MGRWSPRFRVSSGLRRASSGRGGRRFSLSLVGEAVSRSRRLDLTTHAGAFAAQQLLCTVPLIVAISAVVAHGAHHGVAYAVSRLFALHGSSEAAVVQLLGRPTSNITGTELAASLVISLVFTTSVGAVQQRAFELVWEQPRRRGGRAFALQLAWTPSLAVFSVAMLAAAGIAPWIDGGLRGAGAWAVAVVRMSLVTGFYVWSQYWLLDRRVRIRPLVPGAAIVGAGGILMVAASDLVLPGQISWQVRAYGLVGAGFVFATWLLLLSVLIFVGILAGAFIDEGRARLEGE